MIYPLVGELAAAGAPVRVPVALTCRVLKIAKLPFYRWLANPVSDRDWSDAQLTNAAIDIHKEDPVFGYRFIADEIADLGLEASGRRVWRLCSEQRLWSAFAKKKGTKNRKQGPPARVDHVQRKLTATAPNVLWLMDVTEHWTGEETLYLCAIKDVFSNRIVGYSIADNMTLIFNLRSQCAADGDLAATGLDGSSFGSWQSRRIQLVVATPRFGGVWWFVVSRQQIGRCVRGCGRLVIRGSSDPLWPRSGSRSPKG